MKVIKIIFAALLLYSTSVFAVTPIYYPWMSGEVVNSAWKRGYTGQGSHIIVYDFFDQSKCPNCLVTGNLDVKTLTAMHGSWVGKTSRLLSPNALLRYVDYYSSPYTSMPINIYKTNIINNSFAVFTENQPPVGTYFGNSLLQDVINHARNGTAVVVKAAGNNGIDMGTQVQSGIATGKYDSFNTALIDGQSTIYAGALSNFGNSVNKASLASYSNKAGPDVEYQKRFLVTGVRGYLIGFGGTSIAAPIISSYAGIVASKFRTATPTQVANQLLNTARTDTLMNYDPAVYGRGEVSISRALAPISIK